MKVSVKYWKKRLSCTTANSNNYYFIPPIEQQGLENKNITAEMETQVSPTVLIFEDTLRQI